MAVESPTFRSHVSPHHFPTPNEKVLQGLHWQALLLYLDEILVVAKDFPTNMECLADVFKRLRAAGLKLKLSKCEILKEKVLYLGHNGPNTAPSPSEFYLILGSFGRINTNHGVQFESDLMKDQYRLWGTAHTHTMHYHRQADDVVE